MAKAAGDLARGYFNGPFEVEWKADRSPVTVADRRAEELIRALVVKHFPADGFLGEEFGDQPGTSGYRWVIDPIDGTKNFVRGIPFWAVLIGLEEEGEVTTGVVLNPVTVAVSWAAFVYPMAFLYSADQQVLTVGTVTSLIRGDVYKWGMLMAGALMAAAPPLVIYAFLMDYYIAGLTAGATKG